MVDGIPLGLMGLHYPVGPWFPLLIKNLQLISTVSNAACPRHYMGGTAQRATDNVDQNPLLQQKFNKEQASAQPTHNRSQELMID